MDSVVSAEKLTRSFGQIRAVHDLDLDIRPGETYGLLGPNGSGKTTLIRMILGLLKPTSGRLSVLGRSMPDPFVLTHLGYMTQSPALYQDLTVQENLRFFASMYDLHGSHAEQPIAQILGLVQLEERAKSVVSTLSGGMRQRVSLACALLHQPRLLLLDEPTVGVDPQLRVSFWSYFRQLNEEGVTIILSSHVMDEAERCHRLGLLYHGSLLAQGSPSELRAQTHSATLEEAFLQLARSAHEP